MERNVTRPPIVLFSMMMGSTHYLLQDLRGQRQRQLHPAIGVTTYHIEMVHNPLTSPKEKRLIHTKSGKIALKQSEISVTVRKALIKTKGDGAKKRFRIVGRDFVGLGVRHGIQ